MSRAQASKRDRGRKRAGLPPKLEPKYGYCPDCGQAIHNRGAHSEACSGRPPAHEGEWREPGLRACQALVLFGHGGRKGCSLPQGHGGPHQ